MKNRLAKSDTENRVVRLLQREADAETPDFSPILQARIMRAISLRQAAVVPTTVAHKGDGGGRRDQWGQLVEWAAALATIVMIALASPWRPSAVDTHSTSPGDRPSTATESRESLAGGPEPAVPLLADPVVNVLYDVSVAAALAGDWIVETVGDETVIERHWDFWHQNVQAIGDALLDPLPISWEPADSDRATAARENS